MTSPQPGPQPFPLTSRYAGLPLKTTEINGVEVTYVSRRFLPAADSLPQIGETQVQAGDRLDTLANRVITDPTQWWRIADANPSEDPTDLTDPAGQALRVTLSFPIPGSGNA